VRTSVANIHQRSTFMKPQGNARQRVLLAVKNAPGSSISDISAAIGFTYEAVRQQITGLEREGWIRSELAPQAKRTVGRPLARYRLTIAGEHLFPKHYDVLANAIIATAARSMGADVVRSLLASVTDQQVQRWRPILDGLTLDQKLARLRDFYVAEDPFMAIEKATDEVRIVERNCPYLNTALEHPELCSVSVMTLRRLLGYHVTREERFQTGHGRCVFTVDLRRPLSSEDERFSLEDEQAG
jgi:predicted ArsR family transcriptional regulator